MEKIMVIVFDDEAKAHQGIRALRKLDDEGDITVYGGTLLRKEKDGTLAVPEETLDDFPVQTLAGSAIGGLIGMLAGPTGFAAGASVGALTGMTVDLTAGTVDEDFLDEVSEQLIPGTAAVVVDVDEEWITPVDFDLEPYSKAILRRPKVDVEDEMLDKRIEASDKEMEVMEQEWAQARDERKANLKKRIDDLRSRTQKQIAHLKERQEQVRDRNKAKMNALQSRVSTSTSETKVKAQARLDAVKKADIDFSDRLKGYFEDLQKKDQEFSKRIDSSVARGLHKVADKIERKTG